MMNPENGSSRFEMQQLPPEVAAAVENLKVGELSPAFVMKDQKRNQDIVAVVRLTNRIPGHRATLADDYNLIKEMYENHARQEIIRKWIEQKIKSTYTKVSDGWGNCEFQYQGWNR